MADGLSLMSLQLVIEWQFRMFSANVSLKKQTTDGTTFVTKSCWMSSSFKALA